MPDVLRKIEAYKRREIAEAKVRMPFKTLERKAREHDPPRAPGPAGRGAEDALKRRAKPAVRREPAPERRVVERRAVPDLRERAGQPMAPAPGGEGDAVVPPEPAPRPFRGDPQRPQIRGAHPRLLHRFDARHEVAHPGRRGSSRLERTTSFARPVAGSDRFADRAEELHVFRLGS